MLNFIRKIFEPSPVVDYKHLLASGAQIIDVRTAGEFSNGHIHGSKNISLNALQNQLSKIDKQKPVIVCCASGMRSASAAGMLKNAGFKEVYNGGGWMSLQKKLNN
jgi:phage shock protein E